MMDDGLTEDCGLCEPFRHVRFARAVDVVLESSTANRLDFISFFILPPSSSLFVSACGNPFDGPRESLIRRHARFPL